MIRTINGKDYNFKMTRKGIRAAEQAGMDLTDLQTKPLTADSYLWYAALYAAQPITYKAACDLMDNYLDDDSIPETMGEIIESLSTDYTKVFGLAAE